MIQVKVFYRLQRANLFKYPPIKVPVKVLLAKISTTVAEAILVLAFLANPTRKRLFHFVVLPPRQSSFAIAAIFT